MLVNGIRVDSRDFMGACVAIVQTWYAWLVWTQSWKHNMALAMALDTWTWPREDVSCLGLIDEDVCLLRGVRM